MVASPQAEQRRSQATATALPGLPPVTRRARPIEAQPTKSRLPVRMPAEQFGSRSHARQGIPVQVSQGVAVDG